MKFQVGTVYATRSIGDHDCIIRATIVKRTAKTVTTNAGKTFRVGEYDGHETFFPWGKFSMSPIMTADRIDVDGKPTRIAA